MTAHHIDQIKTAVDGSLGVGAITSPFWLAWMESGLKIFMLAGGAVLLAIRILIAWREWRAGKQNK